MAFPHPSLNVLIDSIILYQGHMVYYDLSLHYRTLAYSEL